MPNSSADSDFNCVQMVGVGTSDVNLDKYRHTFCSLLGKDTDSWGLSYTGKIKPIFHCCCLRYIPYEYVKSVGACVTVVMQHLQFRPVLILFKHHHSHKNNNER